MACDGAPGETGERRIIVSTASSLTAAMSDIETEFEASHADVDVILNIAGSNVLVAQALNGASIDVFASADRREVEILVDAGLVAGTPRALARNRLRIGVPRTNPGAVSGIADLADPARLVGLCAPEVPCGRLARRALDDARVEAAVDTEEPSARALATRLEAGELDAGIVYATDIAASDGAITGIDLPEEIVAEYVVARLGGSREPAVADQLVTFLTGPRGRAILRRHGFSDP